MPINAKPEYFKAKEKYNQAASLQEKIKALQEMLKVAPDHKGSQTLRGDIKTKISKYRKLLEKEKQQKKKSGAAHAIKKEGAATVCIVGTTNSGKSTLLNQLTNSKIKVSQYPFTTSKPEIGILDYNGVKIQLIEIPAIIEYYLDSPQGPFNLGIIRLADLLILTGNINLVKKELRKAAIRKDYIVHTGQEIKGKIWNKLGLIKVYTKEPGKKPKYPPVPLKKGSTLKDFAREVHQDFVKQFKYARVWGKSAKHKGQRCGLNHKLKDNDIVELHIR